MTEAGRVNRISVAVLVDGSYTKNEKGQMVYAERSKEQLDRIARWCARPSVSIRSAAIKSRSST